MQNFVDPAIPFFVFGIVAGTLRSSLEIPPPIARFLSLYLLMALGLKGGFALAKSGLTAEVVVSLACALALATVVPAIGHALLVRRLSRFDAAAIAATCGSVSAVTFITAAQYLETQGTAYGGHMAAAMALMESPAIVMAVVLANAARRREGALAAGTPHGIGKAPDASPSSTRSIRCGCRSTHRPDRHVDGTGGQPTAPPPRPRGSVGAPGPSGAEKGAMPGAGRTPAPAAAAAWSTPYIGCTRCLWLNTLSP